jgi:hypothetical protein
LAKNLGNLKFGDISLKKFDELAFSHLTMISQEENSESSVNIDMVEGTFSLYDMELSPEKSEKLTEKELIKAIEKKLKSLGVSLAGYGKVQIEKYEEENIIGIFYPQLINGHPVRNPNFNQQEGVRGHYVYETNQISFSNVDIAKYAVSNYPTLSEEEVLANLAQGGDYFNGGSLSEYAVGFKVSVPELVYLVKNVEGEVFYVPGLRFVVSDASLGVDALYKELVKF